MKFRPDRIKTRRDEFGYTQGHLGELIGVSQKAVAKWESGNTKTRPSKLKELSEALNCSEDWLLGHTDELTKGAKLPPIQIIGYIGAGGTVEAIEFPLDTVERPPQLIGDITAVQVKGSSMQPSLYDGDVVFYSENSTDIDKVIGKRPVIVNYGDGMIAVKQVMYGSQEGLYTLISINQSPITDIKVNWVAKIDWIKGG